MSLHIPGERTRTSLVIPVSNDGSTMVNVHIHVPTPLTTAEWEQLLITLEAMKPALVEPTT